MTKIIKITMLILILGSSYGLIEAQVINKSRVRINNKAIVRIHNPETIFCAENSSAAQWDLICLQLKVFLNFDLTPGIKEIDSFSIILPYNISPRNLFNAAQDAVIEKIVNLGGPKLRDRDVLVFGAPDN